jgi:hypothetical protein
LYPYLREREIMANRFWKRDRAGLEQGVVDLYASVAIGATGAPTLSAANSKGVASIARNSAGKYTLTLQDQYNRILALQTAIKLASGAPSATSSVQAVLRSDSVSSKSVVIEFVDSTGAAVEVVSGATLLVHLQLKNSSV